MGRVMGGPQAGPAGQLTDISQAQCAIAEPGSLTRSLALARSVTVTTTARVIIMMPVMLAGPGPAGAADRDSATRTEVAGRRRPRRTPLTSRVPGPARAAADSTTGPG